MPLSQGIRASSSTTVDTQVQSLKVSMGVFGGAFADMSSADFDEALSPGAKFRFSSPAGGDRSGKDDDMTNVKTRALPVAKIRNNQ